MIPYAGTCQVIMDKKDLNYYMGLPYSVVVQQVNDESGQYYHARVIELEGCQSTGDTADEAFDGLREAMEGYIETKLEAGFEVPEPHHTPDDYSGKFNVRIPKTLHQRLSQEAEREGVSLNQYVLYKLAK